MTNELANYAGILEVKECGQRYANQLIGKGYPILFIGHKAWEANRRAPQPTQSGPITTYIRSDIQYVLGRTADNPPFPAFNNEDQRRYEEKLPVEPDQPSRTEAGNG